MAIAIQERAGKMTSSRVWLAVFIQRDLWQIRLYNPKKDKMAKLLKLAHMLALERASSRTKFAEIAEADS